jgi:hypothetical protein
MPRDLPPYEFVTYTQLRNGGNDTEVYIFAAAVAQLMTKGPNTITRRTAHSSGASPLWRPPIAVDILWVV